MMQVVIHEKINNVNHCHINWDPFLDVLVGNKHWQDKRTVKKHTCGQNISVEVKLVKKIKVVKQEV